jgi:hypothetical protein
MSESSNATDPDRHDHGWAELILGEPDAEKAWAGIFDRLLTIALESARPSAIDKATITPDRLLAESAWNLWQTYPHHAPTALNALKRFWSITAPTGTAVLVLDGLSLRELNIIAKESENRSLKPSRLSVLASEVPTETDAFAAGLGLPSRSKLADNKAPASFIFAGEDTYTDVLDAPFEDCVAMIPAKERIFVWHKWPDFPLIDENGKHLSDTAVEVARRATRETLTGDGFWRLVNKLRQGRRLVITSDHGYGIRDSFSSEEKDSDSIKLLREFLGARRCAAVKPDKPWPRRNLPPLTCVHNGQLVVMGQRWWSVQGGFPALFHGGLSLLEATVPYIEFEAVS